MTHSAIYARDLWLNEVAGFDPRDEVSGGWRDAWHSDEAPGFMRKWKPFGIFVRGRLAVVLGRGQYEDGGLALPWVWAAVTSDRKFIEEHKGFIPATALAARKWLDANAEGCYTRPEAGCEAFLRPLRLLGFKSMGGGLWRWRS